MGLSGAPQAYLSSWVCRSCAKPNIGGALTKRCSHCGKQLDGTFVPKI